MMGRRMTISTLNAACLACGLLTAEPRNACAEEAADERPTAREHTITVHGEGEVRVEPDRANVELGVTTEGPEARPAIAENDRLMARVIEALGTNGVTKRDLQTHAFVIDYRPATTTTAAGYHVRNTVSVTLHDMRRVGDVLQAGVAAGANDVSSLSFSVANPDALGADARERAMANARRDAEALARGAGVTVGDVVAIVDVQAGMPMPMAMRATAIDEGSVPIEPGRVAVRARVEVKYAIGAKPLP